MFSLSRIPFVVIHSPVLKTTWRQNFVRFVVHKHLHGFVRDEDVNDMGVDANASQKQREKQIRRGNLDIVGLQFDENQRGRQLPPTVLAQAR